MEAEARGRGETGGGPVAEPLRRDPERSPTGGSSSSLQAVEPITSLSGDQAFTFIGDAAFTGAPGRICAASSAGGTFVFADVDGGGDLGMRVAGVPRLNASDFIL